MTGARSGPRMGTGAPARPRVLVVAESLPWPPVKGGDLRSWQNVQALTRVATVGVFGLCSNDGRRDAAPPVPLACWTTSTDPALTSPPPKAMKLAARAWLLDPAGHPSDLFFSNAAASELGDLVTGFQPDVVVVEGLWLHRYLPMVRSGGARTILDCLNVETALFRGLARAELGTGLDRRVIRDVLPARTEAIERAAVRMVDQLWVCSDDDARTLQDCFAPTAPVAVVPNTVRLDDYDFAGRRQAPTSARTLTLVYTGIFSYQPNALAAHFLTGEILPRLARACDVPCRLELVGAMPTSEMREAQARDPRVLVTGAVPDIRPHLATATVMPVPLFQGSGTRFKILEAFAAGVPVVSTAKGAEGLDVVDGVHLLLAEAADEFVDDIMSLWRDADRAAGLAGNARSLVAERYSWEAVEPRIRSAIDRLLGLEVDA